MTLNFGITVFFVKKNYSRIIDNHCLINDIAIRDDESDIIFPNCTSFLCFKS